MGYRSRGSRVTIELVRFAPNRFQVVAGTDEGDGGEGLESDRCHGVWRILSHTITYIAAG